MAAGGAVSLGHMIDPRAQAVRMMELIDASPSPYHAAAEVAARLEAAGFRQVDEDRGFPAEGRRYLVRGGSLVAWATGVGHDPHAGFRVVGAHTDSPNLRIKPNPDTGSAGWRQLAVEVYGGALLNSWLDRDLGVSGRVALRGADGSLEVRLVKADRPLLRIPQLAIHLDRDVNQAGLKLNPQTHLNPLWSLGPVDEGGFVRFLAAEAGVAPDAVLGWEAMLHDVTPSRLVGLEAALVSAPRIDNLASCHAGLEALIAAADAPAPGGAVPVLCLFDHEEVGSATAEGAAGPLLEATLERVLRATGGDRGDLLVALARSRVVSADGAHATHPNHADRHEPNHHVAVNGGPVLKVNSNARYATDAAGTGWFALACERAGVPLQRYVVRSDMACGSTIGPVTAARLGVPTVDVGLPQLAMHSARELCGAEDPAMLVAALTAFLTDAG